MVARRSSWIVFGANTDVGKTLVSASLCRALTAQNQLVRYIKPVQTGTEFDADKVQRAVASPTVGYSGCTLFHWPTPCSPHLAAAGDAVTNAAVVAALAAALVDPAYAQHFTLVETAGGVLSPGPGQDRLMTQADLYQPLFAAGDAPEHKLPVLLVGDANLGGISATLCALEALEARGYAVRCVCMAAQMGNDDAVARLSGLPVYLLPALPAEGLGPLQEWYLASESAMRDVTQDHDIRDARM
jgi:dethiobiotin synthetase/adenosylmethionine--8-amino-7-oxononanoate aminotransferase